MSAVAVQTGDVIVIIAAQEGNEGFGLADNGSATAVEQYLNIGNARIAVWTYVAIDNENLTVSVTLTHTIYNFGGCAYHFRGSDGVGVKNQTANTSGDPAVTLSGVSANSAIVMIVSDWAAVSGTQVANETIGTFNPMTGYPGDGAHYGVFGGYYDDGGSAGNKAIGQTDPNGLNWTIAGIEVLGTAGGPVAAVTGTATASITESDITTGGKTIIITLSGDTFIPS
jgi:hypothetical protein